MAHGSQVFNTDKLKEIIIDFSPASATVTMDIWRASIETLSLLLEPLETQLGEVDTLFSKLPEQTITTFNRNGVLIGYALYFGLAIANNIFIHNNIVLLASEFALTGGAFFSGRGVTHETKMSDLSQEHLESYLHLMQNLRDLIVLLPRLSLEAKNGEESRQIIGLLQDLFTKSTSGSGFHLAYETQDGEVTLKRVREEFVSIGDALKATKQFAQSQGRLFAPAPPRSSSSTAAPELSPVSIAEEERKPLLGMGNGNT